MSEIEELREDNKKLVIVLNGLIDYVKYARVKVDYDEYSNTSKEYDLESSGDLIACENAFSDLYEKYIR
jgi:hypothetical protein